MRFDVWKLLKFAGLTAERAAATEKLKCLENAIEMYQKGLGLKFIQSERESVLTYAEPFLTTLHGLSGYCVATAGVCGELLVIFDHIDKLDCRREFVIGICVQVGSKYEGSIP